MKHIFASKWEKASTDDGTGKKTSAQKKTNVNAYKNDDCVYELESECMCAWFTFL